MKLHKPLNPKPLGRRSNPNEGRCILVVGRLGSGKTSYAVHRAFRLARRYSLPVFSNAPLREDVQVLSSWQALAELELDDVGRHPAVLVLDELHLWYPSAVGLMPKDQLQDAFELISYARKRGWTIIATSQAPTRVHTGFRQVMTELVKVRPTMQGIVHTAALLDPDTHDVIWNWYGAFSPRRAHYDTRAEVRPLWAASREAAAARSAVLVAAPVPDPIG